MNQKILTVFISTVVGATVALAVCVIFFFYIYRPASAGETPVSQQPKNIMNPQSITPTPATTIPVKEIKAADVSALSIETVYRDFFDANSKCHKTYNEFYGDADGVYSDSSPCTIQISFARNGEATKSIEMRRYDNTGGQWRVAEKSLWRGKITDAQFKSLLETVVNNEIFQSWSDGVSVTVSNCKITANYLGGTRTLMSNVDKRAEKFLPLMNAFKNLEPQIEWEKAQ